MENEQINNIKNKDLLQHIQDYVDSRAIKMVINRVADDNWSIIATVPKPPRANP